jgi:hypothetical protein
MTVDVFRFSFSSELTIDEAEMTLQLATFAAEGLFSAARVRLDFSYHFDPRRRVIIVDGSNEVGATVVKIFAGLLLREFGDDSFRVDRVDSNPTPPAKAAA